MAYQCGYFPYARILGHIRGYYGKLFVQAAVHRMHCMDAQRTHHDLLHMFVNWCYVQFIYTTTHPYSDFSLLFCYDNAVIIVL